MDFRRILYSAGERIARITLNRPDKRNALDDTMVAELTAAMALASRDPAVKAVLLAANGSAFCSGADLAYLQKVSSSDHEQNRVDSTRLATLYKTIYELRKPVVALVNGPALAGGCGLASVCDFVLASRERARFGYTEVHIGFLPAIVLLFLIKRVGEGRARELVLRGHILNADEAQRAGLVSTVVPENELVESGEALLRDLIEHNSATAMAMAKEMLAKLDGMTAAEGLDFAANMNAAARMTADCRKGVQAFLNKQQPEW
jgi:methylglutaconyl-CoA hydratase